MTITVSLSTFATQLLNTVPSVDTEFSSIIRNQYIKQAVLEYGRDKPRIVIDDITGDGGKYYDLTSGSAVVSAWAERFSQVQSIQYPAPTITSDETPVYLDSADWNQSYRDSSITYLWLPNHAPSATETMRVTYTALYAWSAGTSAESVEQAAHGLSLNDYVYQGDDDNETWTSAGAGSGDLLATHQVTTVTDANNFVVTELAVTVPQVDFFAICYKAACIACQALAEKYSRSSDSLITADSVNHISRAEEFSNRAKEYCRLYSEHVEATGGESASTDAGNGAGGSSEKAHAEFVDIDTYPRFPTGRRFLHHGRNSR